jgi:hypothetical protein
MARQVLVRYKVKAERVEEHEALIRNVFSELERTAPAGIRYAAFKLPDGLSFAHLALVSADENPLNAVSAFKVFGERIKERCEEPPVVTELTTVGAFGF